MNFVLLHADRLRSVAADGPLVPAAEVPLVRDAAALLVEAGRLRDEADADIAAARDAARAQGHAEGEAKGRAAAEAATTERLATIARDAAAAAERHQADVARLAIEVVRRIAGEVGAPDLVAAIAERAAASLTPEPGAVVRVAPDALDAVRARLSPTGLAVEADPTLEPTACVLETQHGRTYAGLDVQLAAIGRAWNIS